MSWTFLWIVITVFTILKVLKHSKGKNLKQRAKIIWIATKLFFLAPALIFFIIAILTILISIFELTNLDSATFDILAFFSVIATLLLFMLFWETWKKWEKELEAKE